MNHDYERRLLVQSRQMDLHNEARLARLARQARDARSADERRASRPIPRAAMPSLRQRLSASLAGILVRSA